MRTLSVPSLSTLMSVVTPVFNTDARWCAPVSIGGKPGLSFSALCCRRWIENRAREVLREYADIEEKDE